MITAKRSAILHHVDAASALSELCGILNHVKLSNLQSFLREEINQMNTESITTIYHRFLPINQIVSSDVMQHILSFGNCNQNRTVCQQWNRLNQQNEDNTVRRNCELVERFCPSQSSAKPGTKTWIVHPMRRHLHPMEKRMGFSGPARNLGEVIRMEYKSRSRTTVLLYPANRSHQLKAYPGFFLHLIGVHERCRVHLCESNRIYDHELRIHNLEISSVKATSVPSYQGHSFRIQLGSKVVLSHCTVNLHGSIYVESGSSLEITDCRLSGKSKSDAIYISPSATRVKIARNTFKDFNHAVKVERGQTASVLQTVKIEITDNEFENCSEHPIVQEIRNNEYDMDQSNNCCILKGNRRIVREGKESMNADVVHKKVLLSPNELLLQEIGDPFYFVVKNAVVNYDGQAVVVLRVDRDTNICSVVPLDDPGRVINTSIQRMEYRHIPDADMQNGECKVKVVAGRLKGGLGILIGMDNGEAIIQMIVTTRVEIIPEIYIVMYLD